MKLWSIGHPEIVSKRLDGLSLRLDWMNLPDLTSHYGIGFWKVQLDFKVA